MVADVLLGPLPSGADIVDVAELEGDHVFDAGVPGHGFLYLVAVGQQIVLVLRHRDHQLILIQQPPVHSRTLRTHLSMLIQIHRRLHRVLHIGIRYRNRNE